MHAFQFGPLDSIECVFVYLQVNYAKGMVQKNSLEWNPRTGVSYLQLSLITPANLKSLIDGCVVDRCTAPPDLLADLDRLPHTHYDSQPVGGLKGIEERREGLLPVEYDGPSPSSSHSDSRAPGPSYKDERPRSRDRDYHRRGDYPRDDSRRDRDEHHRDSSAGRSREYDRYRSPPRGGRSSRSPPADGRRLSDHDVPRNGRFNNDGAELQRASSNQPVFEPPQSMPGAEVPEKKRKSRWD